MTEKQQVEKAAIEVFSKLRLDWEIALIEENVTAHDWEIEVEVPSGPELILSIPKGTLQQMKESIRQQTEEEMDRLKLR